MLRSLAMPLVAVALCAIATRAAADGRVVLRVASEDPLKGALAFELRQRGIETIDDVPPGEGDAQRRAHESRVMAQALGADAALWVDAGPDWQTAVVRVVRAEDGRETSTPLPRRALIDEPRESALVASVLVEELLAMPIAPPPRPAPVAAHAPATESDAREEVVPEERVFGVLATGFWVEPSSDARGGFAARGAIGLEWRSGLRAAVSLAAMPTLESGEWNDYEVSGVAGAFAIGVEGGLRAAVPGHALSVGAHAVIGQALHVGLATDPDPMTWSFVALVGGHAGMAIPVGRTAEMGVRIDVDVWLASARAAMPAIGLSIQWGWR
ncbi:hypothetical protein [Sandaracinus amylolyticus]|uniref:hypothetical protein n=1 Tax=Sandaracinus amylolyticus TaxID=927083 RepID=UPI001F16395D|nr:hypothetical protein [Sandaracinus amylolyticus]UJR86050.1 Hypothetical protein I5071_81310 [Sandaracinus amylolyticus]